MPVDLPTSPAPRPAPIAMPAIERPLTGRHVLVMLLVFFAVIIAVNGVMMTLAVRTMPGLAAKSAYEASQRFNAELAAIAAQDRRGWQVDIALAALEQGKPLDISVRDATGLVIPGLTGEARFERPTDNRFDQVIALRPTGEGHYGAARLPLAPGQWDLIVTVSQGGVRQHVSRRRIVIRE